MLRNLRTAAFALLLVAVSVNSPALLPVDADPLSDAVAAAWVCPPCTGGCDEKTYDHPGACPVCGMELIRQSAAAPGSKETAEKPLRLAILLFDGVEIIDYAGPWEVFGQVAVHDHPAFEIYSVAQTAGPLTTSMGMSVNPKYTFANGPAPDVLLLPGGAVGPKLDNPILMGWIRETSRQARVVFSVCNGAFFLARAGLLDGQVATTIASRIPELQEAAPKARVVSDQRFVDNGKIVTAAGLSSGIDGAIHVVEKLFGRGQAEVVATGLEYHWQPDSGWARATLADMQLNPVYGWIHQFADRSVVRHSGTPERWETRWKFTTDKSGSEILKDLEPVAEKEKWSPAPASAGESGRAWQFSDREGRVWRAAVTVEPVSGDPKGRLLTVKVARAG
jgi:putative intracellular protease/amidase